MATEEKHALTLGAPMVTVEGIPEGVDEVALKENLAEVERVDIDRKSKRACVLFKEQADAMRLLERGSLLMDDMNLEVFPVNGSIYVQGVSKNTSRDSVELFFENTRRSRGGEVDQVDYNPTEGTVVVSFVNLPDAFRVVDGPPLTLESCQLRVSLYNPFKKCRTIKVRGLLQTTSRDTVEMFFESTKKSGGGEIENMQFFPGNGEAVITFYEAKDAESVVSKSELTLEGSAISVEWQTTFGAILVKGLNPKTQTDTVKMYFESKKRSGGGPISTIKHNIESGTACIVFQVASDAQSVLSRKEFKLDEVFLKVLHATNTEEVTKPSEVESGPDHALKTILVKGLKSSTNIETVKMYFENKKRSGGGKIVDIQRAKDDSMALITYEHTKDAMAVLQRKNLTLEGKTLYVYGDSADFYLESPRETDIYDDTRVLGDLGLQYTSLEVISEGKTLSTEVLSIFFENKSNGGEVVSCRNCEEENVYVVTFSDTQGAQNVVNQSYMERFQLDNTSLKVRPLELDTVTGSSAIVVKNLPLDVKEDTLIMFFESKRSGGGLIEAIYKEQQKAVITFTDSNVAWNVLDAHEQTALKLEDQTLQVTMLQPPRPPHLVIGTVDKDKVLVTYISEAATTEELKEFLETKSDCNVNSIIYGLKDGTAMAEFDGIPDYDAILRFTRERPLCDRILCVQQVEIPNSIQVWGVTAISCDLIRSYFENERKSGGGPITDISYSPEDDDCVVIIFKDRKVLKKVLSRQHKLDGHTFEVRLYYEGLGVLPIGHDPTLRHCPYPEDIEVSQTDPDVIDFIKTSHFHKNQIEKKMDASSCTIIWPNLHADDVILRCTINQSKLYKHGKDWKTQALKTWNSLMSAYNMVRVNTIVEAWQDLLQTIGNPQQYNNKDVTVVLEGSSCSILICGEARSVKSVRERLEVKARQADENLKKRKSVVSEKVTHLKPWQIKVLEARKFRKEMKGKQVAVDITDTEITFRSNAEFISQAKIRMFEIINEYKFEVRRYSDELIRLLNWKEIRNVLNEKLKTLYVLWTAEKQKVSIYAVSDQNVLKAFQIIESTVTEVECTADKTQMDVLKNVEWKDFKHGLKKKGEWFEINVLDKVNFAKIIIASTSSRVSRLKSEVEKFLNINCIAEERVTLSFDKARLMKRHFQSELDDIQSSLSNVAIHSVMHLKGPYIKIRGAKLHVKKAQAAVESMIQGFASQDHPVTKPGMEKFFGGDRGEDFISDQEGKHKTVVIVLNAGQVLTGGTSSGSVAPDVMSHFNLSTGVRVSVACGDLSNLNVGAIVCTSNPELQLKHGLAKYLVSKGGESMKDHCYRRVQRSGALKPGEVHSTSGGNLPCQTVFFMVAPRWRGGGYHEADTLLQAVRETLKQASMMNLVSIAIPALGVGNSIPERVVINTIIQAVMELEQQMTVISEVFLIDSNRTTVQMFSTGMGKATAGTRGVARVGAIALEFTKVNSDTVKTNEGITIKMFKGSIAQQKVDVIVNTTSKNLHLDSGGAISKCILMAAGPEIQQECSGRGVVQPGEIAVTQGYKLPCKKVYHGLCPNWTKNRKFCEATIRQFLQTCLTTAEKYRCNSIAFPAIGTGACHVPSDLCAQMMYEESAKFSTSKPKTLQQITFVVYDKDKATTVAFEAFIQKLTKTSSAGVGCPRIRSLINQSTAPGPLLGGPATVEDNRPGFSGNLGSINLHVRLGDITSQKADGIVNSTNASLASSPGVSKALSSVAGQAYITECRQVAAAGGMKNGVAVTGAGQLHAKHVIHAETQSKADDWRKVIDTVLLEAVKLKLASIALPALGMGQASSPKKEMAVVLLEAIGDLACSKKKTSLRDITIVILSGQSDILDAYAETINDKKGSEWKQLNGSISRMPHIIKKTTRPVVRPRTARPSVPAGVLTLRVCADTTKTLQTVMKNIEGVYTKHFKKEIMSSATDKKNIARLTEFQVSAIKALESQHSVKVSVERRAKQQSITIQGCAQDVKMATQCIYTIFSEAQRFEAEKKLADVRRQQITWYYYEDGQWNTYETDINDIIEKAHDNKKPYAEWAEETGSFRVIFAKNIEVSADGAGVNVPVKRVVAATCTLPACWDSQNPQEIVKLVQLSATTPEYKKVEHNIQQTAKGSVKTIKEIRRVQNPSLFKKYSVQKDVMEQINPKGTENENYLWHGTAADTIDSICYNGFDRGYCGKNGTSYGKGVYFAKSLSYSARYGIPDANGDCYVFYSRVLTGRYKVGDSSMSVTPIRSGNIHYDSTVDTTTDPTIFVIFSDTQAYPDYLVKFA